MTVEEIYKEAIKHIENSTCIHRSYCAIIANDNMQIYGYSHAPTSYSNCVQIGKCKRNAFRERFSTHAEFFEVCQVIHAEMDVVIKAKNNIKLNSKLYLLGINNDTKTIYKKAFPCEICKKILIRAGFKDVYVYQSENDVKKYNLLNEESMLQNHQEIIALQASNNLFDPYKEENVQGASYDLHIGTKVYISCSKKNSNGVLTLSPEQKFKIPPNSILMFQTEEKINIPDNYAGKLSLRMGFVRKGLMMPSQTQADPGYNNFLFGFIYNLSNKEIELIQGEHIVSIELYKLSSNSDKTYRGNYEDYRFEEFVSNHVQTSLDFLNTKIDNSQRILKYASYGLVVITIIIAILTATIAIQTYSPNRGMEEKIRVIEEKNKELKNEVISLRNQLHNIDKELEKHKASEGVSNKNK